MSFLDVDTSNAEEPKVVAADKEYKIRIIGYLTKENEDTGEEDYIRINANGEPYLMPRFDIPSEPMAKEFTHYVPLPSDSQDEKTKARNSWRLEEFKRAFKFPGGKVDLRKTEGNEGFAILGIQEDEGYGESNRIKKLVVPK